ncbi:MAG TPA: hypothetical protein LFV90_03140 [Rickettsia endosymbiont of Columbicola hoogstraali]|nr:hypothetical protein [Rickettsia endosymbiont of Columbicola hoogstraali]
MYSSLLFLTLIELALTVIKFTVVLDLGITSKPLNKKNSLFGMELLRAFSRSCVSKLDILLA